MTQCWTHDLAYSKSPLVRHSAKQVVNGLKGFFSFVSRFPSLRKNLKFFSLSTCHGCLSTKPYKLPPPKNYKLQVPVPMMAPRFPPPSYAVFVFSKRKKKAILLPTSLLTSWKSTLHGKTKIPFLPSRSLISPLLRF